MDIVYAPSLNQDGRRIVILPIGSWEQHGPHLPTDTDLRIANLLAEKVKNHLPSSTVYLPALPFSCSWEHRGPGTISLNLSTLAAVIHNIAASLRDWGGFTLLILLNWHGGNDLGALATEVSAQEGISCAAIPSNAQVGKAWGNASMTMATDVHAGAIETAIVKAYWPEVIEEGDLISARCEPDIGSAKVQSVLQTLGSCVTDTGIWGAPGDADVTRGIELIDSLVREIAEQITSLFEYIGRMK